MPQPRRLAAHGGVTFSHAVVVAATSEMPGGGEPRLPNATLVGFPLSPLLRNAKLVPCCQDSGPSKPWTPV
jgi:hypothetical protein